jgi:hypothetical protein
MNSIIRRLSSRLIGAQKNGVRRVREGLVHGVAFGDLAFSLSGDHEGHARQGGVGTFDVCLIPYAFQKCQPLAEIRRQHVNF